MANSRGTLVSPVDPMRRRGNGLQYSSDAHGGLYSVITCYLRDKRGHKSRKTWASLSPGADALSNTDEAYTPVQAPPERWNGINGVSAGLNPPHSV